MQKNIKKFLQYDAVNHLGVI